MEQTSTTFVDDFEHVNLNDVDLSFKAVDQNFYTLEVTSLTPKKVEIKNGANAGVTASVIDGRFTIVEDDKFSGRQLKDGFWSTNTISVKLLRKIMDATGVVQAHGESLLDWAAQYALLSPPARLQVLVEKTKDKDGEEANRIKWFTARAA